MSETEENTGADFELDINLDDPKIEAWGGDSGPPLPPGTYDFELTSVEQGQSKAKQPVLKITFTVMNEGELLGRTMKRSYSLQPQSLPRLKSLMMAAGARLDAIRRSELEGKMIVADVIHKMGDPYALPDGTMKEGQMNGDIINERQPEGAEVEAAPAPAPEPAKAAAKAAAAAPATAAAAATRSNNVRRAVGQTAK